MSTDGTPPRPLEQPRPDRNGVAPFVWLLDNPISLYLTCSESPDKPRKAISGDDWIKLVKIWCLPARDVSASSRNWILPGRSLNNSFRFLGRVPSTFDSFRYRHRIPLPIALRLPCITDSRKKTLSRSVTRTGAPWMIPTALAYSPCVRVSP